MRVFFEWDDTLNVGVREVDRHHRRLVQLINDLYEAMVRKSTQDVLAGIVKNLLDYTVYHFAYEEKYFDQFRYSDAAVHKKGHAEFVKRVTDYQRRIEEKRLLLSLEVMQFLKKWLNEHIKGSDRRYVALFHEKGLS